MKDCYGGMEMPEGLESGLSQCDDVLQGMETDHVTSGDQLLMLDPEISLIELEKVRVYQRWFQHENNWRVVHATFSQQTTVHRLLANVPANAPCFLEWTP